MPKSIAYEWSQTATHLSLLLRMPYLKPKPTQRQPEEQLSVVLTCCFLRVCRHPLLLELDFWGEVEYKAATVSPARDTLSIVVQKSKEGFWDSVAASSNPQLRPADIKERRELALAAYAEWQQQLHQQRVAERRARQEQQQKLIWEQQRQQREWQQQQKDLQVQQVLKQLEDENEPPSSVACCEPAATPQAASKTAHDAAPKVGGSVEGKSEKIVFIEDVSDTEPEIESSTPTRNELDPSCAPQEDPGNSLSHTEEAEIRSCSGSHQQAEAASQSNTAEKAEAEPHPEQQSFDDVKDAAQEDFSKMPVTVPDTAFSATDCKTIKLSFGARRPNRVPARGPRAPPLPQAASAFNRSSDLRDKPGDLARLQQRSPQWLQSKALRLLSGGDPAAAADAYTAALEALPQPPHQLSAAKILCGRSLARLANGDNQKALADCNEALGVLQEVQMQEDAAAAAAGQMNAWGPLKVEASRLQHVLLARRAAALLRLDNLEKAAESLEELQQLQQQHLQLQEDDPLLHLCDASEAAAVTADLQNVRRLMHARQLKDEADAALRVGLKRSQQQQKLLSLPSNPTEHKEASNGETPQASAQTKPAPAAPLLHRSIYLYMRLLLNNLLPISYSKSGRQEDPHSAAASMTSNDGQATEAECTQKVQADGATPLASSCGDEFTAEKTEETTENVIVDATEIAAKVTAAGRAAAAGTESFSCAAAAAAVLSNMALALLQLQEESACSSAQAVAGAANELVELVEKKCKTQQVASKRDSQLGQHPRESEVDSPLVDVQEKNEISLEKEETSLPSTISVLHKSNEQLLARLKQRVSARLSQTTRQ
ncbi:hypothetical protein Emed_002341 [Eimeria media]